MREAGKVCREENGQLPTVALVAILPNHNSKTHRQSTTKILRQIILTYLPNFGNFGESLLKMKHP